MSIHKLTSTDAFVAFDLDDAPAAGVVRCAPKILQGGAKDMARSLTYAFATVGMQRGGASAGINAQPDGRDDAIAAFVEELTPMAADGDLALDAAKGVASEALAPLHDADNRNAVATEAVGPDTLATHLAGLGPVLAAERVLGGLEGRTIAVEGFGAHGPALVEAAAARGASVAAIATTKGLVPGDLDAASIRQRWDEAGDAMAGDDAEAAWKVFGTKADVLFCGSKVGAINHETAGRLAAGAVVPHSVLPFTARALAVMQRGDIAVVADFIPTAAPLLAHWPTGDASVESIIGSATDAVTTAIDEAAGHEHGAFLGACHRAEEFLRTWRETLPFGRPLAS